MVSAIGVSYFANLLHKNNSKIYNIINNILTFSPEAYALINFN